MDTQYLTTKPMVSFTVITAICENPRKFQLLTGSTHCLFEQRKVIAWAACPVPDMVVVAAVARRCRLRILTAMLVAFVMVGNG